jgi:hypothetical protein
VKLFIYDIHAGTTSHWQLREVLSDGQPAVLSSKRVPGLSRDSVARAPHSDLDGVWAELAGLGLLYADGRPRLPENRFEVAEGQKYAVLKILDRQKRAYHWECVFAENRTNWAGKVREILDRCVLTAPARSRPHI